MCGGFQTKETKVTNYSTHREWSNDISHYMELQIASYRHSCSW